MINKIIQNNTLSDFGLTREMLEDLPEGVMKRLEQGGLSPLLPITVVADNGEVIHASARISLYETEWGDVQAMFYPKLMNADLSRFDDAAQRHLNEGGIIVDEMPLKDGSTVKAFYQIDVQTNQLMSIPVAVIENNLQFMGGELKLSEPEMNCLRNGTPLTVQHKERPYTLGVNLNERSGVRVIDGDEKRWRETEKRDYIRYNFGLNGCWIANEEGGLDYLPEEDYTDDIWEEMKKRGHQQRNASTHRL